jgi:uncharacterized membrane protein
MEKNVGGTDRISRWILGGGLVAYGLTSKGWKSWVAMAVGSNILGTAAVEKCFLNEALGVNTIAKQEAKKKEDALVDEASEESFPASDPPSYTAGVA